MSAKPIPRRVATFTEEEYKQRVEGRPGANQVFRCGGAACGEGKGSHYHLAETAAWARISDREVVKYQVPEGFRSYQGQL